MKIVRSAGIIVYRKKNDALEYLLLLYPGGYWEFPKGKLEPGETKEQAAHRELKEETNLEADIQPGFEETISYTFKDRQGLPMLKEVYFFVGQAKTTLVILSHEHRDSVWLPFEQAIQRIMHKNAQELLTKIHAFVQGQITE